MGIFFAEVHSLLQYFILYQTVWNEPRLLEEFLSLLIEGFLIGGDELTTVKGDKLILTVAIEGWFGDFVES